MLLPASFRDGEDSLEMKPNKFIRLLSPNIYSFTLLLLIAKLVKEKKKIRKKRKIGKGKLFARYRLDPEEG